MHEITGGLHIGIENCTTASFTNQVCRTTVPPDKIGLIPKNNYVKNHTQLLIKGSPDILITLSISILA